MTRRTLARVCGWVAVSLVPACTQPADRPSDAPPEPPSVSESLAVATGADTSSQAACDSARTQLEMNLCGARAAREADSSAAAAYESVRRSLGTTSPAAVEQLERAEATWHAYRDAHCQAAAASYQGGSLAPLILAQCRARLAHERQRELSRAFR